MNIGKYLRGEEPPVEKVSTETNTMKKADVAYSVGPALDGDGAVLFFNNRGMVTTIQLPEYHVNKLINLLRAVVPDETE